MPRDLTQVDMRKLELARAMAAKPKLLIADEAMAGLSHSEVDEILALLLRLKERGVAVIMIEHIMRAVMSFSERIAVLVAGRKIADGDPEEVIARPRSGEGLSWRIASPSRDSTPAMARCACSRTSRSSVGDGETVALLGTNGNGKSTLMKCIMGMRAAAPARIVAEIDGDEHDLVGRATEDDRRPRHRAGAGGPPPLPAADGRGEPAARRLPPDGARRASRAISSFCFETFPRLAERRRQLAGSMSGGEQQMLALARALMTAPKILLIDEPSVGLAPILVTRTIDKISELKERYQLTVLMAEQNFTQAIRIADRGYVIVHGKIEFEGRSADELTNNDLIRKFYLGL